MRLKFKFPLKHLRNEHGFIQGLLPLLPSIIGAGGAIGAAALSGGKKGKGIQLPPPPKWYEDPYYPKTQDDLYKFGSEGLMGTFPAYYAAMGEYGGPEFENYLGLVNRDITTAATNDAARRRVR